MRFLSVLARDFQGGAPEYKMDSLTRLVLRRLYLTGSVLCSDEDEEPDMAASQFLEAARAAGHVDLQLLSRRIQEAKGGAGSGQAGALPPLFE